MTPSGTSSSAEVTGLLLAWRAGDASALERLIPLVHAELRRIAHRFMRKERAGHSLQTSALINEAYLRLIDAHNVDWQNRAHFFAISASLMRRILVDFARARQNLKRGGPAQQVSLDEALVVTQARGADLVALDDALTALSQLDPRQSKVVELRFFGGLTEEETAEVLGVTSRTVRTDWSMAKVWLLRELSKSGSGDDR
jgi:RNA polymerase sigma factor (TIGR02999 family)